MYKAFWIIGLRIAALMSFVCGTSAYAAAEGMSTTTPDPFDYSYCGGKPVYPVIGFNFSTYCGPRNQIALGRRGRLMWLFPTPGGEVHARGQRQLEPDELAYITLLAEAAQLAAAKNITEGKVLYEMGINFSGRPYKRVRGALDTRSDSAQALFDAMRGLVPDSPLLPVCDKAPRSFDPTRLPADRRAALKDKP